MATQPTTHDPSSPTDNLASAVPAKKAPPQKKLPPTKQNRPPQKAAAPEEDLLGDEDGGGFSIRAILRNFGACTFSMIFHAALMLLLAAWVYESTKEEKPNDLIAVADDEEELDEEELMEVELQEEIQEATEMSVSVVKSSVAMGAVGGGIGNPGPPQMDMKMVERATNSVNVAVGAPQQFMPTKSKMMQPVPDGARGDERMIVDNVDQALSQITKELLQLLEKGDVMVIWAFDMSESMEEERLEIRDRIDVVYKELGMVGKAKGGRLVTAITSYGERPWIVTKQPTANLDDIRTAIESIPNDPSGKEVMCKAVGNSINYFRPIAAKQQRQMALVLLTDESGEPEDNIQFVEPAIEEAKAARCRIYTLGRQSVFGYPHARMRWGPHPQTGSYHWLLIDRGPETAFVEQLQTNGFRRRHDAFDSGFGPYEQCRLANETGGIFFMLPSQEANLVAGAKRRYELEALRAYRPNLHSRREAFEGRDTYPLRTFLWQVVSDLNPLQSPEKARELEVRIHFSLKPDQFVQQARTEQAKARKLLTYIHAAEQILVENRRHREQEASPRWQANYDLILAQLVTYQIRIYEYGVYLEFFMRNPKTAPPVHPKNPKALLTNWAMHTRRQETFAEKEEWEDYPDREKVLSYISRARAMLADVQTKHPGTPWAARAKWELDRGFGVELMPDYDVPPRPTPPGVKIKPVPKL